MYTFAFLMLIGIGLYAQAPEKLDSSESSVEVKPLLPGGAQAVREALSKLEIGDGAVALRRLVKETYPQILTIDEEDFRTLLADEILSYLATARVSNMLEEERKICRIILSHRVGTVLNPAREVQTRIATERKQPDMITRSEGLAALVFNRDVKRPSDRVTVVSLNLIMRRALSEHARTIVYQTTPCERVR